MTNDQIATLTDPKATRAALVATLKDVGAYKGVARFTVAQLRDYARTLVAELQVEAQPEAAPDAPVEPETAPVEPESTVRKLSKRQIANDATLTGLIEACEKRDGMTVITHADYLAVCGRVNTNCAFSISGWRTGSANEMPSRSNPYFAAALRMGFRVTWVGERRNTGELYVQRLTAEDAQAQRDAFATGVAEYDAALAERRAARPPKGQSASRLAARAKPVSKAQVGRFASAVSNATPDADGIVTLDVVALAMAGIGASWARTSNSHLRDPEHVKARIFAALGYTATTSNGVIVLTPIADSTKMVS